MNHTLAKAFTYGDKPVRTQLINDEPWFCLSDACEVLAMKQPQHFLNSPKCDAEGVRKAYTPTESGDQEMVFINEANLYALVLRSNKTEAIQFQRWITKEVLPEIRKTGRYGGAPLDIPLGDPIMAMIAYARDLRLHQIEQEQRLQSVDNRLARVESTMETASMAVDALPAPSESVRELTLREQCREAINALAKLTGKSQHDLWSVAYGKYDMVHHTLSSVKQKNGGYKTRIDWFEASNRLDGLYAIINKMVEDARRVI